MSCSPSKPPVLVVQTLNVEQYKSYPVDEIAGAQRLREITELQEVPCDILCIQEGVESENDRLGELCEIFGFQKLISSAKALELPVNHDACITNQLFLRRSSPWEAIDCSTEVISSKLDLHRKGSAFKLPVRTVVWAKLKPKARSSDDGPAVLVFNTHISGGRYEDKCFLQGLVKERGQQPQRVIDVIFKREAHRGDVGILVGDMNAANETAKHGHMHDYFSEVVATSSTTKFDAEANALDDDNVWTLFCEYMIAPFSAISKCGWIFAYDETTCGPTSAYGQLVDHMAFSDASLIKVHSVERLIACKQTAETAAGTSLPITDHNAVKVAFDISDLYKETSSYQGGPLPEPSAEAKIQIWAQRRLARMEARDEEKQFPIIVRQCEGYPSVRLYAEPHAGAVIGEVPSGAHATVIGMRGDFLRIRWQEVPGAAVQGWLTKKNTKSLPKSDEGTRASGDEDEELARAIAMSME